MSPRQIAAKQFNKTVQHKRIAFIQSAWHQDILAGCWSSFVSTMAKHGYRKNIIDRVEVPGAFEIPLHAKLLAKTGRYAAIVASGLVVDGGIYRHEFVAAAVINALMQVQLETEVPVLSAVLTPQQFHDHETHYKFFAAHLKLKGIETANACAATMKNMERLARVSASSSK